MRTLRISLIFVLKAAFLLAYALSFPEADTNKEINMDSCLHSIHIQLYDARNKYP